MGRLEKCLMLKLKGYKYDPITGKIFGIRGNELTCRDKKGYIHITIKGGKLFGHHFAWYMVYGNVDFNLLDHINKNKSDNRICNLRIITDQQNKWNNNAKGCYFDNIMNKWRSRITIDKNKIHLGYFNTEEEARNSYLEAKKKYHKIKDPL